MSHQAFFEALDAFKRCDSLDNATKLSRAFKRDQSVMQLLSEPDAGLVRGADKLQQAEWRRRNAEFTKRFNRLAGF